MSAGTHLPAPKKTCSIETEARYIFIEIQLIHFLVFFKMTAGKSFLTYVPGHAYPHAGGAGMEPSRNVPAASVGCRAVADMAARQWPRLSGSQSISPVLAGKLSSKSRAVRANA